MSGQPRVDPGLPSDGSSFDAVIPHTVRPHPDTGINNVKLGMGLFLASEVMLFGALFAAYVMLRFGADQWPPGRQYLSLSWATLNTMILLGSSVTMMIATKACRRRNAVHFRWWMRATLVGGVGFLTIKSIEYADKFSQGHGPETNNFLAIYFTLTGLHVLHLVGGILVNAYLVGPGMSMWHTEHQRFVNRVETAGLYWHFVDVVWLALFVVLYLL